MIKKISFGKFDGYNNGRKTCELVIEVGFREFTGQKPYFTVCASLWNNLHTDIITGGQCIDTMYDNFKSLHSNELYKKIMELWKNYHLKSIDDIPQNIVNEINDIINNDNIAGKTTKN